MKFSQLFEYHEEKNGTFESNGKIYDINKIFDSVENLPTVYFNISDLDWILKYDNPPISNRTDIDYNIPILVAYEENNFLVVDGVHRLKKSIEDGNDIIIGKFVDSSVLEYSKKE